MSSVTGTGGVSDAPSNELQLAPKGNRGPKFGELKGAFQDCISGGQSFVDQCRANYLCRFALWAGQSADGKKHAREGAKTSPTPWDGASDLRVYEVDGAINKKVALYRTSFKKANIVASPIEGNDFKRARIVSNFMKWLLHTQMPDADREVELLANYINEKGVGAMGQFWEVKQEKTLATLTVQQLQAQFQDMDIMAVLMDDSMAETVTDMLELRYGCSPSKARRMRQELIDEGETTCATLGRKISRPVIRAFDLSEQLFIPQGTTDIENATGIYRLEYYTPEQLRAFVYSDNWDETWVEKAIESCRGKQIALPPSEYMNPINRSFVYQQENFNKDQIGVVYAYQRLSDEDNVTGTYVTVFSPLLPDDAEQPGYAKFGLLPYAHGQYPFVLFRREHLTRRLHDTRGIPEPGKSWQDAIKSHRDSRIDAASISIIPPMGYPMGRPQTQWGPGSRIPERRPGEYHFLDKLPSDPLTEQSETIMVNGFKDYNGFLTPEGDPQYIQAITQNEVDKFLTGLAKCLSQVYSLYVQYGNEEVFFRVVGLQQQDLAVFNKADPDERFDFYLTFDVQSGDTEKMALKWDAIFKGFQLLDRNGNVNYTAAIQKYTESIDPNVAEAVLDPTSVGQQRVEKEEMEDLTKTFAGWNVNVRPGTPPQLGLQLTQTYMQSPDVQQRYQSDEAFRARMDARIKQYKFAFSQQQNKLIGRQGAMMPGPVVGQ